jgi:hypothetical protein
MAGEFSVCQFFPDGSYEYVRRGVEAAEAVKAAMHYATSIGARLGTTSRVIITDGGDCTTFEWTWDQGIIFPAEGVALGQLKHGGGAPHDVSA